MIMKHKGSKFKNSQISIRVNSQIKGAMADFAKSFDGGF